MIVIFTSYPLPLNKEVSILTRGDYIYIPSSLKSANIYHALVQSTHFLQKICLLKCSECILSLLHYKAGQLTGPPPSAKSSKETVQ